MNKVDIHKAAGVIVKDRKALVTRSKGKDIFIHPGGKLEGNETPAQALVRELKEEISIGVNEPDLVFFGTFFAPAAGQEEKMLQMDIFIVGRWRGEIVPASEIEEIAWITSDVPKGIKIGSIFEHEVLPRLKAQNLID